MALLGDIIGGVTGFLADRKQNKLAKKQYKLEKAMSDRQIQLSRYIEQLSRELMRKDFSFDDTFGGGVKFNPVTGKYEASLAPEKRAIQEASFAEELDRMIQDQSIRRVGLNDFERMRQRSSNRADRALGDIDAARLGVNRVDPDAISGTLRADRTRYVNAGYDDAAKAATTLQLRTGSSAVGDALNDIARDRVRANAEIGSPDLEGLEFAESINQGREASDFNEYNVFGNEGRSFYDAGFTPTAYDAEAVANLKDLMKLDMSKYDLAMGGTGSAASTVGDAASTLRGAWTGYNQNRIHAPTSKLITGLNNAFDSTGQNIFKMLAGMGG